MVIEAFDSKQTKFKIGMEFKIKGNKNLYYIVDITINDEGKIDGINAVRKDFKEWTNIRFVGYPKDLTLTGNYEPDFLKLRRKLAK